MAKKTRKTGKHKITMGAKPLTVGPTTLPTEPLPKTETKPRTHVAIILDRSSSMSAIRKETVDAFNQQLATIKARAVDQDIRVSLVTFADYVDNPIYWDVPALNVPNLSVESYFPNGWTALYDAVGSTITKFNELPDANDPNTAFLLIIISDGEENRSSRYLGNMLSSMIRLAQRTNHWTFTYVGANQDLSKVSEVLHIPIQNTLSYVCSAAGVRGMSTSNSQGFQTYFASRAAGATASTSFYPQAPVGQTGAMTQGQNTGALASPNLNPIQDDTLQKTANK